MLSLLLDCEYSCYVKEKSSTDKHCSFFFLFSCFAELALIWQRRREKRSHQNDYTEKRQFWQRRPQRDSGYTNDSIEAQKRGPNTLPTHTTPNDMRQSYQTDTTAVGHEVPVQQKKYAAPPAAPVQQNTRYANQAATTQPTHPAHIGQANQAGYTTQPTTHTGYATTAEQEAADRHASYLSYSPQGAPSSYPPAALGRGTAEMPGEEYAQEAGAAYKSYNPPRVDNY